ncbi:hypothetical protein AB0H76_10880 [Nocardia sp. NPDC050712]|uniref:hypothetical protein n=1 Tax=Nocardia sp. NPDC050712 TaxID=3155518 RepID=UPI0033E1657C
MPSVIEFNVCASTCAETPRHLAELAWSVRISGVAWSDTVVSQDWAAGLELARVRATVADEVDVTDIVTAVKVAGLCTADAEFLRRGIDDGDEDDAWDALEGRGTVPPVSGVQVVSFQRRPFR